MGQIGRFCGVTSIRHIFQPRFVKKRGKYSYRFNFSNSEQRRIPDPCKTSKMESFVTI